MPRADLHITQSFYSKNNTRALERVMNESKQGDQRSTESYATAYKHATTSTRPIVKSHLLSDTTDTDTTPKRVKAELACENIRPVTVKTDCIHNDGCNR